MPRASDTHFRDCHHLPTERITFEPTAQKGGATLEDLSDLGIRFIEAINRGRESTQRILQFIENRMGKTKEEITWSHVAEANRLVDALRQIEETFEL
jgi:hypothetical protein